MDGDIIADKKIFRLHFTETQKGYVDVEAENIDVAQDMYLDEYNAGNVSWTSSSITDVSAEVVLT